MTKIIGISGVSGAGKSTLSKALATHLQATYISWDDFDDISTGPEDYVDWYNRGQDYSEWNYISLAKALRLLKSEQAVLNPANHCLLDPTEFIIFDAPLGRLHHQSGQYIDIWIHIKVPLDISLSRRLIRDYKNTDKSKDELLIELEFYLNKARPLFFDDKLNDTADLVLNGGLSTDVQVQLIQDFLNSNR